MDAAQRTARITRAATRFCLAQGWAPVTEVPLPMLKIPSAIASGDALAADRLAATTSLT
jgi:hypothetical protein